MDLTWKDKILLGMKLIEMGCRDNENWDKCAECPFDAYCTALMDENLVDPFEGIVFSDESGDTL